SMYQSQKSSHISEYILCSASLIRNEAISLLIASMVSCSRESIQRSARFVSSISSSTVYSASACLFIDRNRKAFQILLANLRPCLHSCSSKSKSFPAGEEKSMPARTPSAPYCSISLMGSGELPSDFDILRRWLERKSTR